MLSSPTPSPAVQAAASRLIEPIPIRRGSLSERFVKCGKPACACATDTNARHGPYFSWTRLVNGKTQSRLLTREHAEVVKCQIDAGQQFRKDVEAYWEACEVWADEELEDRKNETAEAVKKGGSKQPSRARSGMRSTG